MTLHQIIAGLLITGAVTPVLAQPNDAANIATVGKVTTVYVRVADGLFIEKKLLRGPDDKEFWAEVRSADALRADRTGELFKLPADSAIERGDLVAARLGDPTPRHINLLPVSNKVTQLVARHDTLQALLFGIPNTGSAQAASSAVWTTAANAK